MSGYRTEEDVATATQGSVKQSLGTGVIAVGLITAIFSAGYNWRQVTDVAAAQENFVRKDVMALEMKNLTDRLEDIKQQLVALKADGQRKP